MRFTAKIGTTLFVLSLMGSAVVYAQDQSEPTDAVEPAAKQGMGKMSEMMGEKKEMMKHCNKMMGGMMNRVKSTDPIEETKAQSEKAS